MRVHSKRGEYILPCVLVVLFHSMSWSAPGIDGHGPVLSVTSCQTTGIHSVFLLFRVDERILVKNTSTDSEPLFLLSPL